MKTHFDQLLEELFQQVDELVVVLNRSRKIEFMNTKAVEALQISSAISSYLQLTDESMTEWAQFIENLQHNSKATCVITIINQEKREVTIELVGYFINDKQLIFGRFTLCHVMKTELKEINNFDKLQHLINCISNGVLLTSLNGKIAIANDMALELLKRDLRQIENRSHDCLFEDCSYESHLIFNYYDKLSKKETAEIIVKKCDSNGRIRYIHFESKMDEVLGILLTTITDQSERIMLLEQVEHQKTLTIVGQNVATIAHEIRNPMTSIQGFLQMIKVYSDEKNHEYFNIVESELQRMDDLLKDLLDFSKPKKFDLAYVNLKNIMHEVIDILQPKAILSNTIIECEYDDIGEPIIYGNENRLKQMMINLVKNALESVDIGGYVRVYLGYKSKDCIQLSVSDQGHGMSKTMLENIFDPFYTTKEKGTGLGLLLVQSVVDEHRGKVSVESEEGKGTIFIVDFELSDNNFIDNISLFNQFNDSMEKTS
ncbi:histidine kinase [Solibacillus sp. R5-41]|uniref:ATP-binding protein n=1 Tax=Solibacillus sp. R5-41 TaxID=2048654 RepID=UPI000C12472E|nr:ATP-binding protein [Solibacillus sp. R5-41]ATP39162.1 histidine kinase [Solibacillus sp. R5-41]